MSTRKSRSESKKTDRRREILDLARELLADEGVEALTVGRIATRLGIRAPSLYKHVTGKREIEVGVIVDQLRELTRALEAAGPPTLPEIARAYRAFALANPHLYRLMTERPLPRGELPAGLEERAAGPILAATGDADLARAAWAFAHGMVQLELAGRFPEGADLDAAWSSGVTALAAGALRG